VLRSREGHRFNTLNSLLECVEHACGKLLARSRRLDGSVVTDSFAKVGLRLR
jgi:hypothetical protein